MKPVLRIVADIEVEAGQAADRFVGGRWPQVDEHRAAENARAQPRPACAALLGLIAAVLLPAVARATFLVAYVSLDEVVIAGESRVVWVDPPTVRPNACKILLVGKRIAVIIHGLLDNDGASFQRLFVKALNEATTTPQGVRFAEQRVQALIAQAYAVDRPPDRHPGDVVTGILVFEFDHAGAVHVYGRNFVLTDEIETPIVIERQDLSPKDIGARSRILYAAPHRIANPIRARVKSEPVDYFERVKRDPKIGLARGLMHLVQQAIDIDSFKCGPPIVAMRLTRAGPEWIASSPECDKQ